MSEPFRNPPTFEDVRQCLGKLFAEQHRLQLRQDRDKLPSLSEDELPFLWILSPTASKTLIDGFGGQCREDWCDGIHFLPPRFKTAIVAIHQLPKTPETAWLRALGKGTQQQRALQELLAPQELPVADPRSLLKQRVSSVVHAYLLHLQKQAGSAEEQEILMSLLALHEQWERETLLKGIEQGLLKGLCEGLLKGQQEGLLKGRQEGRQEGQQEGLSKGRQEGQREVLETLLKTRFGPDDSLLQRLDVLLQMPLAELLPWLLNASREELRAKLG